MSQIIFNKISAAEISALPTMEQLELLNEFKVTPEDLKDPDEERFGSIQRDGATLYRFRCKDLRIYFELEDEGVVVHRVLHKNTFQDFRFRSGMKVPEDEALGGAKEFWELIEEGERAARV
ncbi:MAG: hypothetical protein AAF585_04175 [Verrucomicrobiota bacterium]